MLVWLTTLPCGNSSAAVDFARLAGSRQDTLKQLLPPVVQIPDTGLFTPDSLHTCIRANFASTTLNHNDSLDSAFAALRVLSEQMYLQQCSSHTVTHGISVDVTSAFTEKVDLGGAEAYSFIYRVRITNIGDHRAQLLSRHWVIRDADGNLANEVKGPGVIGNTPLLKPYDCFEYYSATFSRTQQGSMGGSFQMLQISPENHKHFDAFIQPFKLIAR